MKQGWEIKKLGEVATYVNGYAFKPEHWGETGMPIIRIQNLNNPNAEYNYCDADIPEKFVVENGDILISWSASLGVYEWNRGKAYLNQHIFKVVFNKVEINKYFLKYAVNAKLSEMLKDAHGATMKHIVKGDFDNTIIPYPSREEQERIVEELDCLSGVIEKKREQLRELDALAQSIFYQMFGDPITNEKGWEVKKLGEVCDVCSSRRVFVDELVEDGVPFYRGTEIGQMAEGEIIIPTLYITPDHYERLKDETGIPQIGDLLLPSICNDGRIWLVSTDAPYYFKDGRVLWIKCAGKIDGQFLRYQLKNIFINNYNKIASGTTFAELKIFILRELKINIPPLALQQQFADRIERIEQQKELIKKSISETQTLFNARMEYYFN